MDALAGLSFAILTDLSSFGTGWLGRSDGRADQRQQVQGVSVAVPAINLLATPCSLRV
jgi:hypothetical protein